MKVSLAVKLDSSELTDMPFVPQAPKRLAELDIPRGLLEDLVLRHAFTKAATNLKSLNKNLKIPISILLELFQLMRQRQLFEIVGMEGNDYNFTLSDKGRDLAGKRFYTCQYAGPAPVPVKSYFSAVRKQKGNQQTRCHEHPDAGPQNAISPQSHRITSSATTTIGYRGLHGSLLKSNTHALLIQVIGK